MYRSEVQKSQIKGLSATQKKVMLKMVVKKWLEDPQKEQWEEFVRKFIAAWGVSRKELEKARRFAERGGIIFNQS